MLKWLEPATEKQIITLTDDLLKETYNLLQNGVKDNLDIELIVNQITYYVSEKAYKQGFDDGLYVGKKLK